LDYSWFVIFALLTWMLGNNFYPAETPSLLSWFMGGVAAVMLLLHWPHNDKEKIVTTNQSVAAFTFMLSGTGMSRESPGKRPRTKASRVTSALRARSQTG
jgi:hypothetical protein